MVLWDILKHSQQDLITDINNFFCIFQQPEFFHKIMMAVCVTSDQASFFQNNQAKGAFMC